MGIGKNFRNAFILPLKMLDKAFTIYIRLENGNYYAKKA